MKGYGWSPGIQVNHLVWIDVASVIRVKCICLLQQKKKCVFIEKSNNAEAPDAPNTGPDGASKYKWCGELCSHLLYPASELVNQPQAAELSTSPRLAWCKLFQRSWLKVLRKPKAEFLASTEPVEVFWEEGDKLHFKSVLDWREESFP